MDDTIAGMGDIESHRTNRMMDIQFSVWVLLELDLSGIGTRISRQQTTQGGARQDKGFPVAIEMEPGCAASLFLIKNG